MDHHVYFWLKDENKNATDRAAFEKALAGLFEIPQVLSGRWAVPAPMAPRPVLDQTWDYAITMQFDGMEGHDAYQVHPLHQAFIESFNTWWAQVQIKDLA